VTKKLPPPSLLHLALLWRPTPQGVAKAIIQSHKSTPDFTYAPLFRLINVALKRKLSYINFVSAIRECEKRPRVQKIFLDLLPLIYDHFNNINPNFVLPIKKRQYVISNDIAIPFNPPFVYGVDGQLTLPWFIFWKKNPLSEEQVALSATLVRELMDQDPELSEANFAIYDFSAPLGDDNRILRITNGADLPRLNKIRRNQMLEIFVDGFLLAREQIQSEAFYINRSESRKSARPTPEGPDLFSDQPMPDKE